MGLFARSAIDAAFASPVPVAPSISAAPELPTFAVQVRAVLELPTATPTTVPTRAPTRAPTIAHPTVNDCGTPEPGAICAKPWPTPPPPTPYPPCEKMARLNPGDFCRWSPSDPSTHGEGEVQ